jgi:hypothetical protein
MSDKQIVKPEQKGGFIQGVRVPVSKPANSGACCGGSTDSGCCGESSSTGSGCCGETVSDTNTNADSSCSCCG